MLRIFTVVVTTALAFPQEPSLDPNVLVDIFGPAPSTPSPGGTTTPALEDIRVKPTDSTTTYKDQNGEECKCVPYYLCDVGLVAVDANNASVTGWGELDIRFGEDKCQESVERCCKEPKQETDNEIQPVEPPRLKGCGYRNPKGLDFTVTGGSGAEAQFGEFPWVVALIDNLNDSYIGVGVLIHPQVVLTGAHIVYRYAPGTVKIRAGEWDTQTVKERLRHQERVVQETYIHSGFNPKNVQNDVALLRLEEPVVLADHINVICLPQQDESFESSKSCVANGWGKDVFGAEGRYAVILKRVEQDMVPHPRCNDLLKRTRLGPRFKLHDSFVCAGGEEGKDTCKGDGGAPLACPIGGNRYKLSGLVAWGIGCGVKDVPAVYVAVARFRNWIDVQMAAWGYDASGYTA